MSSFEYVMVIVAIILGFGITTLLRGAVESLRTGSTLVPGLVHSFWVGSLLATHVGLWSARWYGERREEWPALILFAFLLSPILIYAQSELLFPREARHVRLDEYFIENRRTFFGLGIAQVVLTSVGPFIFYEGAYPTGTGASGYVVNGVVLFLFLVLFVSDSSRLHKTAAMAYFTFLLFALGVLNVG